eukprot:7323784-Prymnesium_polylepis.1
MTTSHSKVTHQSLSRTCPSSITPRALGLFEVAHNICAVLQGLARLARMARLARLARVAGRLDVPGRRTHMVQAPWASGSVWQRLDVWTSG